VDRYHPYFVKQTSGGETMSLIDDTTKRQYEYENQVLEQMAHALMRGFPSDYDAYMRFDRMKELRKAEAVLEFARWAGQELPVRPHSADLTRMEFENENRGETMTDSPRNAPIIPLWNEIKKDHVYRNKRNRELKDEKAILNNKDKHWQDKMNPESNQYFTRVVHGSYSRIREGNDELPDYIQGSDYVKMKTRLAELEQIIEKNNGDHITDDEVIDKSIARLIERSTNRYKSEAESYRDSYYREQERKNKLITENRELKAENERLKKTGIFPVEKKGQETLSDREKRFTSIDV
jgi:hypothetical protein